MATMKMQFKVSVEVSRTAGKFSTRDSLVEELREAIESADPGTVTGDGDEAEYQVDSWEVEDQ